MYSKKKTINVEIPPRCEDGKEFVLRESGSEQPGFLAADLVIVVKYHEHDNFNVDIDTYDLYTSIEINLLEALYGGEKYIKFIDNSFLHVTFNLNEFNEIKTIKNYGMKKHSHLHVRFNVKKPRIGINKRKELEQIFDMKIKGHSSIPKSVAKVQLTHFKRSDTRNARRKQHEKEQDSNAPDCQQM